MSREQNIAYLATFQKMYLTKDVFLIPYYLARAQHVPLKIIYGSNQGDAELPKCYRNAVLVGHSRRKVSKTKEMFDWILYVLPYASRTNSLFFCGCSAHHMLLTWILLKLNQKISIIVFGDMEEPQAQDFFETGTVYGSGLAAWTKRKLANHFFNHVKFLVANERAYGIMQKAFKRYNWQGLVSLYPCLDDELFNEFGLQIRPWSEKENIMISVGRIGNYQKNTEMLLKALGKVHLNDWKVYLIGPLTDSFCIDKNANIEQYAKSFFQNNPHLIGKIIFTGLIYDQKELFNYFLRAKVYLSSARHEGFANVFSQAAALGCYIISTDVGGAETASNNWQFGTKIEQENDVDMAKAIQMIIDDESTIQKRSRPDVNAFLYSRAITQKLIPCL